MAAGGQVTVGAVLLAEMAKILPAPAVTEPSQGRTTPVDIASLASDADLVSLIRQWRPEGELRAAASVWSKYLFRLLLPPLVLPRCRTGQPLVPAGTLLLAGGLPQQWKYLEMMAAPHDLVAYLTPWVTALAEQTGVRPRVLWSNLGNQLEALLGRLPDELPGVEDAAHKYAALWLGTEYREKRRNPLYRPVMYRDGKRLRRVCCLRYRLTDLGYCTTCPLPAANP